MEGRQLKANNGGWKMKIRTWKAESTLALHAHSVLKGFMNSLSVLLLPVLCSYFVEVIISSHRLSPLFLNGTFLFPVPFSSS